jgi:hypothetical protein
MEKYFGVILILLSLWPLYLLGKLYFINALTAKNILIFIVGSSVVSSMPFYVFGGGLYFYNYSWIVSFAVYVLSICLVFIFQACLKKYIFCVKNLYEDFLFSLLFPIVYPCYIFIILIFKLILFSINPQYTDFRY